MKQFLLFLGCLSALETKAQQIQPDLFFQNKEHECYVVSTPILKQFITLQNWVLDYKPWSLKRRNFVAIAA